MNSIKRVSFFFLAFVFFLLACSLGPVTVSLQESVGTPTPAGISLGESATPKAPTTPISNSTPGIQPTPTSGTTLPETQSVTLPSLPAVSVTSANPLTGTQKISSGNVDLDVTGLELTQGVSNELLVLGKAAIARVHVSGIPAGSNVDAQVTLEVNGKTYEANVTLVGPDSTINIKIDAPHVVEPINAQVTVSPANPVTDASAANNSAAATVQTVQTTEKVFVFFLPVDWSPDDMSNNDFANAYPKFVQDNADFFAGAYPLAQNQLEVDYTTTPHMLSAFEKTLSDSQGKFSYRNALALYGSIAIAGRRYAPSASIVVGVLPPKWFKNHGRAGTLGLTLRDVKGTVTGEFDANDPTTAAHEVAHLYYLYEDYDYAINPPRPGVEITSPEFWIQHYRELTDTSTQKLWTFLSAGNSKVIYWTDNRIYDFLLARYAMNGGTASAPTIAAATMAWEIQDNGQPAEYSAGILRFEPRQPIYCSVAGISLNAGSQIEARIFRGASQINTLTQTASGGNNWYAFTLSQDGSLGVGQYRVDVYLDGKLVKQAKFEVKASQ